MLCRLTVYILAVCLSVCLTVFFGRINVFIMNSSCGVYILSVGLLQFAALRFAGHSTAQVQSVQNATARLITGTRRRDHITPVLRELH